MDRKDIGPVLTTSQLSEVRALLRQLQRSGSLLELAKPSVVSLLRAIDVENDGTTVLVESPRIDETGDIAIPDEVVDLKLLLDCRRERDEARAECDQLGQQLVAAQDNAVVLMERVEQRIHQRDEALAEAQEQARLLGMSAERELALRAENERLKTAMEQWHDAAVRAERNAATSREEMIALIAQAEALSKCCTQRGARMQIMREWMDRQRGIGPPSEWWYFVEERPEARDWFDEEGEQ